MYLSLYLSIYICICVYIYIYMYMYLCMYVCMYVSMYVSMYMFINIRYIYMILFCVCIYIYRERESFCVHFLAESLVVFPRRSCAVRPRQDICLGQEVEDVRLYAVWASGVQAIWVWAYRGFQALGTEDPEAQPASMTERQTGSSLISKPERGLPGCGFGV